MSIVNVEVETKLHYLHLRHPDILREHQKILIGIYNGGL